jgi:iron complex outermembrane receptor protein
MLGATALTAPIAATPALAQEGDAGASDRSVIIVTAQRRDQALEDVPMSVTVLSQDTLDAAGVASVRDLADVTSGFQVNNSGTYTQPAIRGVTTTNSGSYENNVALFVDGLYQITPQVLNADLPNVQNIQILKGPQGTLYGRNATGGAILIETIDPGEEWEGNAELTYGRFDDKRARAYVAGPLSDMVGISLAGTFRKTDGYYKRASLTQPLTETDGRGLGLEQHSFRAKLKFDLTETFRATVGYNYLRADDPRGAYFTPNENTSTPYPLGVFAGNFHTLDLKQHEGVLKLELDTGLGLLRSVSGYTESSLLTEFDSSGTDGPPFRYSPSKLLNETWQTNLDYNIDAIDRVNLLIGGSFFHNKEDYAENLGVGTYAPGPTTTTGSPGSTYTVSDEVRPSRTKEAWAIFGELTFDATDQLSVTVGGRYSEERQRTHSVKTTYGGSFDNPTGIVYDAVLAKKYSKFTPSASIRYEITPRTSVYASYT